MTTYLEGLSTDEWRTACRNNLANYEREKAARIAAEAELRVQRDYTRIALNDLAAAKTALAEERAAREKS